MIGLFDSGYGGLTILRALIEKLPAYNYIYLGDNARAPYGDRSPETIYEFARQGADFLFRRGSIIVILACNTASAVALRRLQQEWLPHHFPDRRILGIVVPTIEQITSSAMGPITIGILATEQTICSGAYELEIHKRNPSIRALTQACPGLVAAIETSAPAGKITAIVKRFVTKLQHQAKAQGTSLHSVLLGCTHYELIVDIIRRELPAQIRLYEQPAIVAKSLKNYFARHAALAAKIEQHQQRTFLTTGDPHEVASASRRYFSQPVDFERAILPAPVISTTQKTGP